MSEYIVRENEYGEVTDYLGVKHSLSRFEKREEIVRCGDCKFYDEDDGYGNYGCTLLDFGTKDMERGYCAWGERREP